MDRRRLIAGIIAALSSARIPAAQHAGKARNIGYLSPSLSAENTVDLAFADALRERGYVDGETIVIHRRYTAGRDRFAEPARELVQLIDMCITNRH